MFALASYWFSFITLDRSMDWVIWMIVGRYITIGFIFTPINAASMMLLPPDKVRMGAGLINIMQQGIGGTVGLAMMTTMLERRTAYHASMLAQQHVSSPIEWGEVLAPVRTLIQQAGDIGELLDLKALALLQRLSHTGSNDRRLSRLFHGGDGPLRGGHPPRTGSYGGSPPSRGRHTAQSGFCERNKPHDQAFFGSLCGAD